MSLAPPIWVSETVLRIIGTEARKCAPLETGGILLGYRSADHEQVITHALGPGPDASHDRIEYVPDYPHDRRSALDWWEKTNGTEYYLGDWHSHPECAPYLSNRDEEVLGMIALDQESQLTCPVMLVVGLQPVATVAAWRLRESELHNLDPEPCELTLFKDG